VGGGLRLSVNNQSKKHQNTNNNKKNKPKKNNKKNRTTKNNIKKYNINQSFIPHRKPPPPPPPPPTKKQAKGDEGGPSCIWRMCLPVACHGHTAICQLSRKARTVSHEGRKGGRENWSSSAISEVHWLVCLFFNSGERIETCFSHDTFT